MAALYFINNCLNVVLESNVALKFVAVVVADSVLLNKNSSFIFSSFSYRAKAIKWLSKALSVDSSS